MSVLLAALGLLAPADDEAVAVTLHFKEMHCEECRLELEAGLKRVKGFKAVEVKGGTVTARFGEKAPIPELKRLPRDLVLVSTRISIRGTVSRSGDKTLLVARGSGAVLTLRPPPKPPDRLAELHGQMGGKNRFRVGGGLVDGRVIVLETFGKTDWKDE